MKSFILKSIPIILLFIGCSSFRSNGQSSGDIDCFELKYMDFFELPAQDTLKFSDSDLNKMLLDPDRDKAGTNFIIPMIVHQLKFYHPLCNMEHDTSQYQKLTRVYFKIRQMDMNLLNKKTISEQLEFIRKDFYKQVEDPEVFINMIFTFDDGPLYGENYTYLPDSKTDNIVPMDFGKLIVINKTDSSALVAIGEKGEVLWSKIIKGSHEENIKDLEITAENTHKTSAAYKIYVMTNGYNLMLYLKPDGRFICYFQHW